MYRTSGIIARAGTAVTAAVLALVVLGTAAAAATFEVVIDGDPLIAVGETATLKIILSPGEGEEVIGGQCTLSADPNSIEFITDRNQYAADPMLGRVERFKVSPEKGVVSFKALANAQQAGAEPAAESTASALKPWWKRDLDDLIPRPVAFGAIGILLVVSVIQSGNLVDPLKHWAGLIVLWVAVDCLRGHFDHLHQRVDSIDVLESTFMRFDTQSPNRIIQVGEFFRIVRYLGFPDRFNDRENIDAFDQFGFEVALIATDDIPELAAQIAQFHQQFFAQGGSFFSRVFFTAHTCFSLVDEASNGWMCFCKSSEIARGARFPLIT